MRALTVLQPYASAIALSDSTELGPEVGKQVENRSWEPWKSLVGDYLAIHAGARPAEQEDAIQVGRMLYGQDAPHSVWPEWIARLTSESTKILCIARVARVARLRKELRPSQQRWKVDQQYGWVLEDVRKLLYPIVCRGAQGLWLVPREIEIQIREQVKILPAPQEQRR